MRTLVFHKCGPGSILELNAICGSFVGLRSSLCSEIFRFQVIQFPFLIGPEQETTFKPFFRKIYNHWTGSCYKAMKVALRLTFIIYPLTPLLDSNSANC